MRQGAFTGEWLAITRHTIENGLVKATEKHTLDPVSQAEIELNNSVLRDLFAYVRAAWSETVDGSDADRAYKDVLDKIHALTETKREQLLGPREAAS
ncbi:MAG: hypothetical protein L0I76_23050 [Pseudonocardia sp.]|nr:hypothetical protein [Pseudonocardia sp.]